MASENAVLELVREVNPYVEFNAATSLIEDGVLDSLSMLFLISSIEERFAVKIPEDEFKVEHFVNVVSIVALIEKIKASR